MFCSAVIPFFSIFLLAAASELQDVASNTTAHPGFVEATIKPINESALLTTVNLDRVVSPPQHLLGVLSGPSLPHQQKNASFFTNKDFVVVQKNNEKRDWDNRNLNRRQFSGFGGMGGFGGRGGMAGMGFGNGGGFDGLGRGGEIYDTMSVTDTIGRGGFGGFGGRGEVMDSISETDSIGSGFGGMGGGFGRGIDGGFGGMSLGDLGDY